MVLKQKHNRKSLKLKTTEKVLKQKHNRKVKTKT